MKTQALTALASLTLALAAIAQPTSFTYQGQLKTNGQPSSGAHDFQFRLFDAPAGGTQLGPTLCVDSLALSNGVFTTTLDFGQQYTAATPPRFLEVQVRQDTGLTCSNLAGMLLLSPRLPFSAAASAAHALSACELDAPSGAHPNALFLDNSLSLGVGTTQPQATLHLLTTGEGLSVQGSSASGSNLSMVGFYDANGTRIGAVGDISTADNSISLVSDAGDVHLLAGGAAVLTARTNGGVGIGIGTIVPTAQLDVRGDITLATGVLSVVAGQESLRIVRGTFSANGGVINGAGYSVTKTATGKYRVDFSPSFAGLPAITATVLDPGGNETLPFLEFAGAASVTIEVFERDGGEFVDRSVQFIAAGPR
jgi:hypothetical protein